MQCLELLLKFKYYLNHFYQAKLLNQIVVLNSLEDALIFFNNGITLESGDEVIKLFPFSTQLSTKLTLLINVKMPTIVASLTFISLMNTIFEIIKARHFFICRYTSFMSI